jgi:hypothetical protein
MVNYQMYLYNNNNKRYKSMSYTTILNLTFLLFALLSVARVIFVQVQFYLVIHRSKSIVIIHDILGGMFSIIYKFSESFNVWMAHYTNNIYLLFKNNKYFIKEVSIFILVLIIWIIYIMYIARPYLFQPIDPYTIAYPEKLESIRSQSVNVILPMITEDYRALVAPSLTMNTIPDHIPQPNMPLRLHQPPMIQSLGPSPPDMKCKLDWMARNNLKK